MEAAGGAGEVRRLMPVIQHAYPLCRWITFAEAKHDFGVKRSFHTWCRNHPEEMKRTKCKGKVLYWLPDVLRYAQDRKL